jgi:hypothetical protein
MSTMQSYVSEANPSKLDLKADDSDNNDTINSPLLLVRDKRSKEPKLVPFDPTKIVFERPRRMNHGGYVVYVKYELDVDGEKELVPVQLQLPMLRAPFGVTRTDRDGKPKTSLALSVNTRSPVAKAFAATMNRLDDLVLATAIEKKTEWFTNKEIDADVLQYFFRRTLKESHKRKNDGEPFDPLMNLKFMTQNGEPEVHVFNTNDPPELESLDYVNRRSQVIALVKHNGIWFSANSFTQSYQAIQLMVEPGEDHSQCQIRPF